MPRRDFETLKPSASNTRSRNDTTVPGQPLDIPRKSRPLESRYHEVRIAGPEMVPHPREVSRHTVAQWHGLVTPEGPFASSSSLDGSFPRFAACDEIPIIQTSLFDIGGSDVGGGSMNNIGISWSPSSSFIGGSPSTTAESTNNFYTLSTSDLGNRYSPTGLQQSSAIFALSQGDHLGYLRVPEHGVRRDNVTSSEISRFMGEIPQRTAGEGHRGMKSTTMQLATTVPTLDVPAASEARGRLGTTLHHNTSALAGDESSRSLLSLTRPPPSDGADVGQPVAQPSIPTLPPGLDSVCDSPWSMGGSSLLRDVTSPQNISPGLLNLGPAVHGPNSGTSKQRSTPSSAPHPTTNGPLSGLQTLQFNPSTWPMITGSRVEQKRNRTIPTGDIVTNYTILMAASNSQKRSLVPNMRPNAGEVLPKIEPRSSLSPHPDSQTQPETECGVKSADNDTSITDPKDSLPIDFPARSTEGILLGLVAPITRSTGSVSSLGQHSINLSNASGDAEITSQGFAHYSEGRAVHQPALLKEYQGSQTDSSGDGNYIAQISSESSVKQISATEMQRPPEIPSLAEYAQSDYHPSPDDHFLPTAIPFNADQSRGPAFTSFLDLYSIFSGRELSGMYQREAPTSEHAALGGHGEELHRDVLPDRSVPSRVALLKSPASSATSEPRSSQYTATPEFSHSPSSDFPAGSSTALQRDQTSSEQHFAALAEQIKRILEEDYHRGETTDWCIVYSGIIRRMRTGVSTRGEIAEAMARYLRPPIPNGFKDYLKRRISHVLSHNKHVFVKAEGGEKRHGWKIRQ